MRELGVHLSPSDLAERAILLLAHVRPPPGLRSSFRRKDPTRKLEKQSLNAARKIREGDCTPRTQDPMRPRRSSPKLCLLQPPARGSSAERSPGSRRAPD